MSTTPITVLLAEDHTIVREGLKTLMEVKDKFKIVGEAINGHEAVSFARSLQPVVVVMDIAMPILNGFEAIRQIKLVSPKSKILILSAHSDDEYIKHSITLGVEGYVVKQQSGRVLIHAMTEIASGRKYFSPEIVTRFQQEQRQIQMRGGKGSARQCLTTREAEVLQMVAEGFANKQIASQLVISIKTVEKHRQKLMDKLNIHETAGLTRYAIANDIIEGDGKA